jgi:hypothetical protein
MGWVVKATPRPLYPREETRYPLVWEAGWVPVLVWTGVENLASTGIRFSDLSAGGDSLYWLSYLVSQKRWGLLSWDSRNRRNWGGGGLSTLVLLVRSTCHVMLLTAALWRHWILSPLVVWTCWHINSHPATLTPRPVVISSQGVTLMHDDLLYLKWSWRHFWGVRRWCSHKT